MDSEVLTLLVEEAVGTDFEERFSKEFSQSFVQIQAVDSQIPLEPLVTATASLGRSLLSRVQDADMRRVFAATGLRISSCESLAEFARQDLEAARRSLLDPNLSLDEIVHHVFAAVEPLPQMQPQYSLGGDYRLLLMDWLRLSGIDELAEDYTLSDSEAARLPRFIEDYFGFRLPWGMNGYIQIAAQLIEASDGLPDNRRYLPTMVRYGVNQPEAAWAMTLGCPNRRMAFRLAQEFLEEREHSRGFVAFLRWFGQLTEEDFAYRFDASSHEAQQLAARARSVVPEQRRFVQAVRRARRAIVTRVVGTQFEGREVAASRVRAGDQLQLQRDYGNRYDRNAIGAYIDGAQVGYIARNAARLLAPDFDAGMTFQCTATSAQRRAGRPIKVRIAPQNTSG
jgi:hypothetical protein